MGMTTLVAQPSMPRATLVRKFVTMPWKRKLLLAEAIVWLTISRLALKLVPFPKIARYLGTLVPPAPALPPAPEEERARVRLIGWAVNAAGSHLPVEMVCLPRALAGWQMLHRRGIASRLHFGAVKTRKPDDGLLTHAWLTTPGTRVTGFPAAYDCVELGYFTRPGAE